MDRLLESAKAVVAAVGVLGTLVVAAVADEAIRFDEASAIAKALGGLATAFAVWRVPNRPPVDA